jgi:peptidoglycan lytic transglycosylase G
VAAVLGGVVAALVAWLGVSLYQPFAGDAKGSVVVVVPKGAGVGDIGSLLERRGVISNSFFFEARAHLSGRAGDLKPGTYRLRKDMTYGAAIDALAAGPPNDVVNVVIPEGRSRREVARLIPGGLKGSYLAASRRSRSLNPRRYRAPRGASLEGFLFPASYELKRGRPVKVLVEEQLAAFKREFAKVDLRFAHRKNLTPYDVLIVASMVDREAQLPRERKIIASVIYNRLHAHMRLGIDATVRFATNNWDRPLTQSELQTPSPYNTYLRPGLPGGPIGSPGLAAIQAAAHPARTHFLFYVVKPGTCGEHAFSSTDRQFERDKARYNRARARRGGRSPTNC